MNTAIRLTGTRDNPVRIEPIIAGGRERPIWMGVEHEHDWIAGLRIIAPHADGTLDYSRDVHEVHAPADRGVDGWYRYVVNDDGSVTLTIDGVEHDAAGRPVGDVRYIVEWTPGDRTVEAEAVR